jgi:hypothetical protein
VRNFFRFLCLVAVLVGLTQLADHFRLTSSLEPLVQDWTYELGKLRLPSASEIVIVDLTSLQASHTPEQQLIAGLNAVLLGNPLSVGIDAGTGPRIGQELTGGQRALLSMGLHRPVCFGLTFLNGSDPAQWLDDPGLARQAATLAAPDDDHTRVVYELAFDHAVLPGLAKCMAGYAGISLPRLPSFVENFISLTDVETYTEVTASTFPINFSALEQIRSNIVDIRDLIDENSRRRVDVAGKMVILGYLDKQDALVIPGQRDGVFGVEVQGAALYTLLHHRLYSFTRQAKIFLDVLTSIVLLLIVRLLGARARSHAEAGKRIVHERKVAAAVAIRLALVTVVASLILSLIGLYYPDVFVLGLGAYIHPYVEHGLKALAAWILPVGLTLLMLLVQVPAASAADGLALARVLGVTGKVQLLGAGKPMPLQSKDVGLELHAGQSINATGGSIRLFIYGLRVNGLIYTLEVTGCTFTIDSSNPVVSRVMSTIQNHFIMLGRM